MTTSSSPLTQLQAQADRIADTLKRAEEGRPIPVDFAARIRQARQGPTFNVGIVMDDKVIKIEIPWANIRETGRTALSAYILSLMQGAEKH